MADANEIEALKASFRGALRTAEALVGLTAQVEAYEAAHEPSVAELEELQRRAATLAVGSAALRGLVETMLARRGGGA